MMHRTQVYFEPEVLELLRQEAKEKRTTLASVIRAKVEKNIEKKPKTRKSAAEFLRDIELLGKKLKVRGPKDLSQRIDEFVYR
jgi:hypothetical protein